MGNNPLAAIDMAMYSASVVLGAQTEIALSILEAEYIVLSQGMMDLVSAKRLLAELGERMNYKLVNVSHVSKVW